MPYYLYGLVPSGAVPTDKGVGGAAVRTEPASDELAVLVSDIDADTIQPRRAHLNAHDQVLRAAMAAGAVLPFRFGTITGGDPRAVLEGIDPTRALERLRALEGRVEVQIIWEPDQELAVRRVAERHPEVRSHAIASIDRGKSIAEAVATLALEDLTAIQVALTGNADTFGPAEQRGLSARMPALVGTGTLDRFLGACAELAERSRDAGALRTVGALPPYSFVSLDQPIGA